MSIRDEIAAVLSADETLGDLLPGGVYAGGEISRQKTPGAFDANLELQACALVSGGTEAPVGPYRTSSRMSVSVYLYAASDDARERVYNLLHDTRMDGVWEISHSDDVLEQTDPGLMCSLDVCRYSVIRRR